VKRPQPATPGPIQLADLPKGWRYVSVSDVGAGGQQPVLTGPFGTTLGRSDFIDCGVPLLTISCLTDQGIRLDKALFVSPAKADELSKYRLRSGDLLFSRMASVGRAGIVGSDLEGALFNYHIMRLRLDETKLLPKFFTAYVRGAKQVRDYLVAVNHGATRDGINTEQLLAMPVIVPPLPEQRCIVAEIERQFTRLEAGVSALRRVQAKLKRYRAAVLKAACEGRLVPTEAELARRARRAYESGKELLAKSLNQRRRSWTARGKYMDPLGHATATSLQLPEGWTYATLDALADVKGGVTKDQGRKHDSPVRLIPYLRVANVQRCYLDLNEVKVIPATEQEIRELALKAGDLLFNEGGDRDKLGRGWVWNGELPECIHQNHVFRARLFETAMNPKFVSWYANTIGQKFFFDQGKHTTNLASISMTKLKTLPIPIPPAAEQGRIVAEVERRLSVVEQLDAVAAANLQRATRLRQSILERAFSGRLVSDDGASHPGAEPRRL
jgi:type I restriction enzyme S subunit